MHDLQRRIHLGECKGRGEGGGLRVVKWVAKSEEESRHEGLSDGARRRLQGAIEGLLIGCVREV